MHHMPSSMFGLSLATICCTALAAPAQQAPPPTQPEFPGVIAQQPGQQPGAQPPAGGQRLQLKPHMLVANLPDAQNCPAPDWIQPGMRITYFTSVAQINDAAGSVGMVEDPNGNITDSSGRRYRHGSSVGLGTGGAGWDCVEVIAVERDIVVLEMRQFQNTNGHQGPVTSGASNTMFVHPSGCDFFLHPRLLAQLQQQTGNGVNLIKGQMQHRGRNYNMVLSSVEIPNSRNSSVYDLVSGVQLSHNESTQFDGGVTYKQSGNDYDAQRNTSRMLANNQFIDAKQITKPWRTMQIPAWARTMKKVRYQGQRIDSGTPEMGLGRLVTNLSYELETIYVGDTFTAYRTKNSQQMEGMPAMEPMVGMTAFGPGSLMGVWMDPAALATLKTGQLIDQDNNVGIKFGCEFAGPGNDGKPVVVLAMGNELYKATSTYDAATGKLLAIARIEKSPTTGGTITTQMRMTAME